MKYSIISKKLDKFVEKITYDVYVDFVAETREDFFRKYPNFDPNLYEYGFQLLGFNIQALEQPWYVKLYECIVYTFCRGYLHHFDTPSNQAILELKHKLDEYNRCWLYRILKHII